MMFHDGFSYFSEKQVSSRNPWKPSFTSNIFFMTEYGRQMASLETSVEYF